MATIEDRSRIEVRVKNRADLTKAFPFNADKAIKAYIADLRAQGFKPTVRSLSDTFLVRIRQVGYPELTFTVNSQDDAVQAVTKIEEERKRGLFIDYAAAWKVTFADLLIGYLTEVAPRTKGFWVTYYQINALLRDAGLDPVDGGAILDKHKNPHPSVLAAKRYKPTGKRAGTPTAASVFIRKPFASLVPKDFNDYSDERLLDVEASTVNRELDLFSAVCNHAIESMRITVNVHPMLGSRRPKFDNERDRRLRGDEEERLMTAAYEEDRRRGIEAYLEGLMSLERVEANAADTFYRKKLIVKHARAEYRERVWGRVAPRSHG